MDRNQDCQRSDSLDLRLSQSPTTSVHYSKLLGERPQCSCSRSPAPDCQPDIHTLHNDLHHALSIAVCSLGTGPGLRPYRDQLCQAATNLLEDAALSDPNARLCGVVRSYAGLCLLPCIPLAPVDQYRAKIAYRMVLGTAGDLLAFVAGTPGAIDRCHVNRIVQSIGGNTLYLPVSDKPVDTKTVGNKHVITYSSILNSYEEDLSDDYTALNARRLLDSIYEAFIDPEEEPAPLGALWARAASDSYWTQVTLQRLANFWNAAIDVACISGFDEALQARRNKLMHSLFGNIEPAQPAKPRTKKANNKKTARQPAKPQNRRPRPVNNNPRRVGYMARTPTQPTVRAIKDTMNNIAYSIAACGSVPPIRWGSSYAEVETAVAMPYSKSTVPWTATAVPSSQNQDLPNTDFVAFAFRDYLCANIFYDANAAARPAEYDVYGVGVNAVSIGTVVPASAWTSNHVGYVKQPLNTPYAKPSGTFSYNPHGTLWPAKADGSSPGRYFWLDIGTTLEITLETDSDTDAVVMLDQWTPSGIITGQYAGTNTLNTGTPVTYTVPALARNGYFNVAVMTYNNCQLLVTNMKFGLGVGSHFCHRTSDGFELNYPSVQSARVNAFSILYTNRAAELNKEGSIAMSQIPDGDLWTEFVPTDGTGFSDISKSRLGLEMNAKKGAYVWGKPTKPEDHSFLTYHTTVDGVLIDCFSPLRPQHAFIIMYCKIQLGAFQDGRLTLAHMLEYQTLDTWRDLRYPIGSASLFEEALVQLKSAPQFCENAVHLRSIWNAIKSGAGYAANAITKYGPKVAQLAELVAAL